MPHNYKLLALTELPPNIFTQLDDVRTGAQYLLLEGHPSPDADSTSAPAAVHTVDGMELHVGKWRFIYSDSVWVARVLKEVAVGSATGPLLELLMADNLITPVSVAPPVKGTLTLKDATYEGFVLSAAGPGMLYGRTSAGGELVVGDGFRFEVQS